MGAGRGCGGDPRGSAQPQPGPGPARSCHGSLAMRAARPRPALKARARAFLTADRSARARRRARGEGAARGRGARGAEGRGGGAPVTPPPASHAPSGARTPSCRARGQRGRPQAGAAQRTCPSAEWRLRVSSTFSRIASRWVKGSVSAPQSSSVCKHSGEATADHRASSPDPPKSLAALWFGPRHHVAGSSAHDLGPRASHLHWGASPSESCCVDHRQTHPSPTAAGRLLRVRGPSGMERLKTHVFVSTD
jgi:hypothetical protein